MECRSNDTIVSKQARLRLRMLLDEQRNPKNPIFNSVEPRLKNINSECPVWSHVRKANSRGADGVSQRIIFTISPGTKLSSGLLFMCFQRNIGEGFEYIKKHFLNDKQFPVPKLRKKFSSKELAYRRRYARMTEEELNKLGTDPQ